MSFRPRKSANAAWEDEYGLTSLSLSLQAEPLPVGWVG